MRLVNLSLALAIGLATPLAAHPVTAKVPADAKVAAPVVIDVPASKGRTAHLTVWTSAAARPKGVVVFGHGHGGNPLAYRSFLETLVANGYHVVAPLAVDSLISLDRPNFSPQAGYGARVEDLMIARGMAWQRFAGLPQVLAGHSYGSLFAMIGAGAKSPAGPLKGPPVAAVLALSTPGLIPGLVAPDAFASLDAPMMIITGDRDVVPGFVADPADHVRPFQTSPAGDKYLLTVAGGAHDQMIDGPAARRAALTARALAFLDAYAAKDAKALAALKAAPKKAGWTEARR